MPVAGSIGIVHGLGQRSSRWAPNRTEQIQTKCVLGIPITKNLMLKERMVKPHLDMYDDVVARHAGLSLITPAIAVFIDLEKRRMQMQQAETARRKSLHDDVAEPEAANQVRITVQQHL